MLEPSQNWNCKLHTFFFGRAHFENWIDSLGGWTTTRGKTPEQNVYALIKEVTYGQKLPNHWILFTQNVPKHSRTKIIMFENTRTFFDSELFA